MPSRSKKNKARNNKVMQETTVEDEEDEVMSLLRQKHEIEMEEMKIKQAKEELTVRMQRANVSNDLLPSRATADDSKAVNDRPVSGAGGGGEVKVIADALARNQEQQSRLIATLQMPKVELKTFTGDPLEFWSFMRTFYSAVEANASDDSAKLTRLLQYTAGDARKAIQGCSMTRDSTEGYDEAIRILRRRFGSDEAISHAWINKVSEGSQIKANDCKGLQDLADDLQNCSSVLTSIKMMNEIDHQRGLLHIVSRLPQFLQSRWRKLVADLRRDGDRVPRFEDLLKFVTSAADEVNDPVYGWCSVNSKDASYDDDKGRMGHKRSDKKYPSTPASHKAIYASQAEQSSASSSPGKCVVCSGGHELSKCDQFKKMTQPDRYKIVRENRLCRNCLLAGHRADTCLSEVRCAKCRKRHSEFIHVDGGVMNTHNDSRSSEVKTEASTFSSIGDRRPGVMQLHPVLPVVAVIARAGDHKVATYALLDPGSTHSYCSDELARQLKLTGQEVITPVSTVNEERKLVKGKLVSFQLMDTKETTIVDASNVMAKEGLCINTGLMATTEDVKNWVHLQEVPIVILPDAKVNILIGQDMPDVLLPRAVKKGPAGAPFAVHTLLGWALNGPMRSTSSSTPEVCTHFAECDVKLDAMVERFWKLDGETVEDERMRSHMDDEVVQLWEREVSTDNNHYVLPVPVKDEVTASGLKAAKQRLDTLKKRLDRDQDLKIQYTNAINDLLSNDYAEKVPKVEVQVRSQVHYLPHQPVINPNKSKLRVVFDCAAKAEDGKSLNDHVWSGPDLTNRLVGVLLRFREELIAIAADITAMFHQVHVAPRHRDLLRFLWWTDGDTSKEPEVYRMKVHLFGGTWSPSCAAYALRKAAEDQAGKYADAVCKAVERNFYVDDFMKSLKTEDEAVMFAQQLMHLLQDGGFTLCKWISNSRAVLQAIPVEKRADSVKDLTDKSCSALPTERALGMRWNVEEDTFCFQIQQLDRPSTRRGILSTTCSIFDPCGMLSPFVLKAKLIVQDLARVKLGWDEKIPTDHQEAWSCWKRDLSLLSGFSMCRSVKPATFGQVKKIQLVHFCDASQKAYGTVSYLRLVDEFDMIHCAFISSKCHLAPVKGQTIPRLELMAATTAAKQESVLRRELDLMQSEVAVESAFFTDSQIVLHYIHNVDKRYCVFVANRLSIIHNVSREQQWHHVPTAVNPADDVSRGLKARELLQAKHWLHGPTFLWSHDEYIAMLHRTPLDEALEVDGDVLQNQEMSYFMAEAKQDSDDVVDCLFQRYSSWKRLSKAVCRIRQFVEYLRSKSKKTRENKPIQSQITVQELRASEVAIIRCVQRKAFGVAKLGVKLPQLVKLYPALNEDGLLVVGGRLKNAVIEGKHPVILPKDNHVTTLIVNHYHVLAGHGGVEITTAMSREKFWIITARRVVKKVIAKCTMCKKTKPRACEQLMADLPADRVRGDEPPFTRTGVDFCGPFLVKQGRSTPKRYVCLFTCLQTRAVHLEVAYSLDASSFVNCLQRFVCRRGRIRTIRCDNGTNFIGAERELREAVSNLDQPQLQEFLLNQEIEWIFNPPASSHMGGVWERLIRSTRQVLKSLLHEQILDDEALHTVLCQVENIVNSRPLTYVSNDVRDPQPISPNDLLQQRTPTVFPAGQFLTTDIYARRRWRQVAYIATVFWSRWKDEYIAALQARHKWCKVARNLRVGDIVMLLAEDIASRRWVLGRVVEVKVSNDGLVRSAKVKTAHGVFDRPITKLSFVEEHVG